MEHETVGLQNYYKPIMSLTSGSSYLTNDSPLY